MQDQMIQWAAELQKIAREENGSQNQRILEIAEKMREAAETKEESPAAKEEALYPSIIRKLAQEYFRIFYVDIRSDEYLAYDPYNPQDDFDTKHLLQDFFLVDDDQVFNTLYEEDRSVYFTAFKKEKVLASIENDGEFSIIYRVYDDNRIPVFVNMKGTRMPGDENHIIVGVKNIDAEIKREKDFLYRLAQAKDEANRDGLTGVRNKHAYLEYAADLQSQVEKGQLSEYAVVVFDLNGLKEINDVLGHQAGDRYIQEGCNIVCNTFKRSPVFRVGGDEFTAIAKGADYENLEHLMDQIGYRNIMNKAIGKIVIAAGMARYCSGESVKDVFERADAAMYENKKMLKES